MSSLTIVCGLFLTAFLSWLVYKLVVFVMAAHQLHKQLDDKFQHLPFHWFLGSIPQIKSLMGYYNDTQKFVIAGARSHLLWIGFFRPVLTVAHPETTKAVLKTSEPKANGYDFLLGWIGEGLLLASGHKWERNRKLLTPAFHFDILQPYVKIFNQTSKGFMKNLERLGKGGNSIDVFGPAGLATLDGMLQCSLSYSDDIQEKGDSHPYVNAVNTLARLIIQRSFTLPHYVELIYYMSKSGREFRKMSKYVHTFSEKIIATRKEALATDPGLLKKRHLDFLDILLTAKDETGSGLTDQEIRDEVDTFTFEGHDTTSSAIAWLLYCLALYPEEQQKVLSEVLRIVGDREEITWEDLSQFQYIPKFIKETMRLYPPVPVVSRRLTQPLLIDGVEVPPGVCVDVSMYQMHRNPHVWDDCLEFNPNRFDSDNSTSRDPYTFVPFSAGPRNCIGMNFALNELKVLMCQTVRRFHIDVDPDKPAKPFPEVVLRSEGGLHLKFTPRV